MQKFVEGAEVEWNWAQGKASGRISETFTRDVERRIKGKRIKRKASEEESAYLIEQADGDRVLKSHSELRALS